MRVFSTAIILALATTLGGCSTITRGTHEKVTIVSNPARALCKIYRDGQGFLKAIATPGEVYIQRSIKPITVVCTKDGFETATVSATTTTSGTILGNAATATFSTAVDLINSAHHELPNTISVNLKKI